MAGRPLKFQSVEELQDAIDAYFASVKEGEPRLITGLALALDTCRQTLLNYSEKTEFMDAIKKAKLRCENYAENQLFTGKNQTGAIFALKNYDWDDKQDLNLGGQKDNPVEANLTVTFVTPKP